MIFAIEHHEPNPHQMREALTKNRTYHLMRWKEKLIINGTKEDALAVFKKYGKGYRLVNYDNGEVVRQNELLLPR